eukprot:TRINITY_DN29871_c0_g1_i1.p2 TRINITY_DN29871_c0_g1~~TRINITY_DN29871_c0_g1_i1.p2  ORF type:complete len:112 (+),score=19.26 TRINITY_DN29871_c0_g1_i1:138-473(+)
MGVDIETTSPGDGKTFPSPGDKLRTHYVCRLATTGEKVDSSIDRGIPFRFQIGVGQVVKGWDEGIQRMSLGEKATLRISADCAYGALGAGGSIPPNADLIFEVELIDIRPF